MTDTFFLQNKMLCKHNANVMIINKYSCTNETFTSSFAAFSTEKKMTKDSKWQQLVDNFLNLQINSVKNKNILDYFFLKFCLNFFCQQLQIIFNKFKVVFIKINLKFWQPHGLFIFFIFPNNLINFFLMSLKN